MVQLSTTPSSGATARDADVDRRFVRVVLQLATSTTTAECATCGSEYRHDGQGRDLDGEPDATTTSSAWGGNPAPGYSDPSRAGKLLLSRLSAGHWGTLTLTIVIPIINFLSLFLCVRCYHTGACHFYYFCLTWLVVFVAPRRGCTVIEKKTFHPIRQCPQQLLSHNQRVPLLGHVRCRLRLSNHRNQRVCSERLVS